MFQSPRRGSAAFLNESIVRDIITGRYLEPVIGRLNKGTTWNLRGVASDRGDECIMRAIVFRLGRWRLTEQEEIGWCPRETHWTFLAIVWRENSSTYPSKCQGHHEREVRSEHH